MENKITKVRKIEMKRKEGHYGHILPEGHGIPKWTQLRIMHNEVTGQDFTVGLAEGTLEPIVEYNGKYFWLTWGSICELAEKEGLKEQR